MRRVREEFGLTNVILMIPFCRTVEEAKKVVVVMNDNGRVQGKIGLNIYGSILGNAFRIIVSSKILRGGFRRSHTTRNHERTFNV